MPYPDRYIFMNSLLKSGFSVFFALFIGVQGILLLHISEANLITTTLYEEGVHINDVSIGDYTKTLPIISEGEKVSTSFQQSKFFFPSIYFSFSDFKGINYFENLVKQLFNISQRVEIVVGIRELIFPTHFFW